MFDQERNANNVHLWSLLLLMLKMLKIRHVSRTNVKRTTANAPRMINVSLYRAVILKVTRNANDIMLRPNSSSVRPEEIFQTDKSSSKQQTLKRHSADATTSSSCVHTGSGARRATCCAVVIVTVCNMP